MATELVEMDGRRPLCDGCSNKRGFIGLRDYDYCERCQQMLCAPCVLQWHRNHELRQRVGRLRDLEEVDYKIESFQRTLAKLEKYLKVSFKL